VHEMVNEPHELGINTKLEPTLLNYLKAK
jgi:hypothetical protein